MYEEDGEHDDENKFEVIRKPLLYQSWSHAMLKLLNCELVCEWGFK